MCEMSTQGAYLDKRLHTFYLATPSHYPVSFFFPLLILSIILPFLLSTAPAEHLTRADEKGNPVKGQS